jgi:hypothetical protein
MRQLTILADISQQCRQYVKVISYLCISQEKILIICLFLFFNRAISTTAGELLWNMMKFNIHTGMIETVHRNISGLVMQRRTTFVSVVSIITALILEKYAIVIRLPIRCRMKVMTSNLLLILFN